MQFETYFDEKLRRPVHVTRRAYAFELQVGDGHAGFGTPRTTSSPKVFGRCHLVLRSKRAFELASGEEVATVGIRQPAALDELLPRSGIVGSLMELTDEKRI